MLDTLDVCEVLSFSFPQNGQVLGIGNDDIGHTLRFSTLMAFPPKAPSASSLSLPSADLIAS